jgi:hypothetical protein
MTADYSHVRVLLTRILMAQKYKALLGQFRKEASTSASTNLIDHLSLYKSPVLLLTDYYRLLGLPPYSQPQSSIIQGQRMQCYLPCSLHNIYSDSSLLRTIFALYSEAKLSFSYYPYPIYFDVSIYSYSSCALLLELRLSLQLQLRIPFLKRPLPAQRNLVASPLWFSPSPRRSCLNISLHTTNIVAVT